METAGGKNCDVLSAVWGWIFLDDGEKRGREREREKVRTDGGLERKSFLVKFRLVSVDKTSLVHTYVLTLIIQIG